MGNNDAFVLAMEYMPIAVDGVSLAIRDMDQQGRTTLYERTEEMFRKYDAVISERGSEDEMTEISPLLSRCNELREHSCVRDVLLPNYVGAVETIHRYIQLKGWE